MTWWKPKPVVTLFAALNRWRPKRTKTLDGTIGDAAHRARKSGHNPDPTSRPPGVVRAADIDVRGIHVPTLIAALLVHSATSYVIYNRVIYSRSRHFRRAAYTGSDPHTGHVHAETLQGHEGDQSGWCWLDYVPSWGAGLRRGNTGALVFQLQAFLAAYGYTLSIDGVFGDETDKALRAFQGKHGLAVDGVASGKTQNRLRAVA